MTSKPGNIKLILMFKYSRVIVLADIYRWRQNPTEHFTVLEPQKQESTSSNHARLNR